MLARYKVRIALGATIVAVLAVWIGTSAGGAAGGELSVKEGELPSNLKEMIANPESAVAEFDLQAEQARHVDLKSAGDGVWAIPGSSGGACLFQSDGGGSCANADEIASGRLVLGVVSPAAGDTPGEATFFGYAPAGVKTIRLVDKNGDAVSELTPDGETRVYGFRLSREPGAAAPVKMVLADESGNEVSTLPVPGGSPE